MGSAIFVCLAGVMYESGRFDNRNDLEWQSELLAICVGLVLFLSITYYMVVFFAEYFGKVPKIFIRLCADKKLKQKEANEEGDVGLDGFDLVQNPMNDMEEMKIEMR